MSKGEDSSLTADEFLKKELTAIREQYSESELEKLNCRQLEQHNAKLLFRIRLLRRSFADDSVGSRDLRILYPKMYPPLTPEQEQQIKNTKEHCEQRIAAAKSQCGFMNASAKEIKNLGDWILSALRELTPIWKG